MIRRFFNPSAKSEQSDANVIRYTTTDESLIVFPTVPDCGALMKSHEYGVIRFATPPSRIPSDFVYSSPSKGKIKSIILPDSIGEVESSAFSGCTALESIEFGSGEITFGRSILNNCISLKKMIFHGLNPSISADDIGASSFDDINSSGISVYYPTEDATYITKVIDHLDKPATADVNNFFPVTLVSYTTTVIGKELYDKYADRSNGSFTLDGSVTVDGIVYTSARMLMGQIYFGTYTLTSDGYLQGGPA